MKSKAGVILFLCAFLLSLSFPASFAFAQTLTPPTLSFGSQAVGNASAAKTATFKNTQTAPLTISSIAIAGGTAPADYAWGGTCPLSPNTLAAGKTCKITVTFTPAALGSRTAVLTVTDSVSTSSTALTGAGVAPVSLTPATVGFSNQTDGTTSAAKTITLKNVQTVPLTINSIVLSGANPADYAWGGTCPISPNTLSGKKSCQITVTFTPSALGIRTASLTVTHSASNSPQSAALKGKGIAAVLVSIAVTPANPSISVGATQQFTATGTYSDGSNKNLTSTALWGSSAGGVATIASGGLATGVAAGTSSISAKSGTISGSTTLTVTSASTLVTIVVSPPDASIAAGTTLQYSAQGFYSNGSTANLTNTATWKATAAATISTGGLATGVSVGTASISATVGTVVGIANLTVTAPLLVSIAVTPANPTVALGASPQFTATGTYSNGSTQNLTDVATWSSSNTGVAQIGSTGIASALGFGQTTIQAAFAGIKGSTGLTVTAGFASTGSLNTARDFHTATMLNNGMVLIAGGNDSSGNPLSSAELYNPATGTFTDTGSLNSARVSHTATLLNNGMVLIAGGESSSALLTTAELYNPATGTFSIAAGNLNSARLGHTATLLSNGMVLIAGGENSSAVFSSAELYNPATETFTFTGSLNAGRANHTATLLNNGMVLLAGGGNASGAMASAELYNPATGTFATTGSLNAARALPTATLLNGGMVLIAGGEIGGGVVLASAELYDPTAGTFAFTGSMNSGRVAHTATLLNNGMVLMAGGEDSNAVVFASAELYDPIAGTFSSTGSLNTARALHTATLLNSGTVLIAGGATSSDVSSLATAELYQPATLSPPNLTSELIVEPFRTTLSPGTTLQLIVSGALSNGSIEQLASATWSSSDTTVAQVSNDASNPGTVLAIAPGTVTITATDGFFSGFATLTVRPAGFVLTGSPSTGRYYHTATRLNNGMVLIAGGVDSSHNVLASAELYNPATGTFTATGSMNTVRYGHTATLLNNGMVLIAAGNTNSLETVATATAELYNPATGTFTYTTGSLNAARLSQSATLLNNGMVLIAGGYNFNGTAFLSSAELYNPATQAFTYTTGSLNTGREQPTATLLDNGMVLIVGGMPLPNPTATAELYNPATQTFAYATGSLNTARQWHTATLLNNGMVLIAGGYDTTGNVTASAELFNSATGTFAVTGNLNTARELHTATLLNDGMVLIAAGQNGAYNGGLLGSAIANAELYNPATGTFAVTGGLNTARENHTATLLNGGTVLIVGGETSLNVPIGSAELY